MIVVVIIIESTAILHLRATLISVSLLNESVFLNESGESLIQWLIDKDAHLIRSWMNQSFERIG